MECHEYVPLQFEIQYKPKRIKKLKPYRHRKLGSFSKRTHSVVYCGRAEQIANQSEQSVDDVQIY